MALDIHLTGRLCKGEVVGTEPGFGACSIELLHHSVQGSLQVRHGNVLINHHALHLVEHRGMGGIYLILPVYPARGQDADGERLGLHGMDLHGRGLAAEHHPTVLIEIEGIRPVSGRMALLCVQTVKIVVCQFHFRAIQNGKAHPYKNVLDFVQGNIHGVLMSQLGPLTRDGYIHRLCFQAGLQLNFLNLFFLGVNLRGQSFPHFIGQLTNDRALFRAELSHLLEHSGEFSLFAQVFDPKCLQIHRFLGDGQGGQSLLFDLFQLFLHSASSQIKKPFLP